MDKDQSRVDPGPAARELASGIRNRVGTLVLSSSLAVGLVFGLSFYFALVANESAIARQVPELGPVAAKMKGLLFANTIVFTGIIVVSFWILSRIVTARLFRPLGAARAALAGLAQGKIPHATDLQDRGAFGPFVDAIRDASMAMRDRREREDAELRAIAEQLDAIPAAAAAAKRIRDLAGKGHVQTAAADAGKREAAEKDPLFIQPV